MPKHTERSYYVYILTNRSGTLYIGVTNDLMRRLNEHRQAKPGTFTGRYKMDRLAYFEETSDVTVAIEREKQLTTQRMDTSSQDCLDRGVESSLA